MEIKNILLLFLLILLILSNQFNSTILSNIDNSIINSEVTQYGNVIKSIFIIIGYICIEKMIEYDLL
jgi:hypothetical protein